MRPCRLSLRLLLSAVVLGASTTPLALRHCHVEGDGPHHLAPHGPGHMHGHPHGHGPPAAASMSASACHVHLLWFGIDFTMPGDHDEREHDPQQHPLCQVRVCEHECLKRSPEAPDRGAAADAEATAPGVAPQQPTVLCAPQFTFAPLCDVARRERTGVLRA